MFLNKNLQQAMNDNVFDIDTELLPEPILPLYSTAQLRYYNCALELMLLKLVILIKAGTDCLRCHCV